MAYDRRHSPQIVLATYSPQIATSSTTLRCCLFGTAVVFHETSTKGRGHISIFDCACIYSCVVSRFVTPNHYVSSSRYSQIIYHLHLFMAPWWRRGGGICHHTRYSSIYFYSLRYVQKNVFIWWARHFAPHAAVQQPNQSKYSEYRIRKCGPGIVARVRLGREARALQFAD